MSKSGTDLGTQQGDEKLHKIVKGFVFFCLFGLVIEGGLFIPVMVTWYGWPTLSMQEICDEMHKVIYDDPTRVCKFPVGLLEHSEPRRYAPYTKDLVGNVSPVNPMPRYKRIGFRELVELRDKRLAEEAKLPQQMSVATQ
jgi:hypothetical protein